jgi:XTP/dITP diphosphohydrolase
MKTLTFITTNAGKYEEVMERLFPLGIDVKQLDHPYPEIQADTLEEVARAAAKWCIGKVKRPFMLEDAGLFIDALGGFPGVYSAYAYKTLWLEGIIQLMEKKHNQTAHFESVICLVDEMGVPRIFIGTCSGWVIKEMRGTGGFGFDPIFVPYEHEVTFAEMSVEEKNAVSHRGAAMKLLVEYLEEYSQ